MYLIPLIRLNRAIATTLIIPNEPVKAIAISENELYIPVLRRGFIGNSIFVFVFYWDIHTKSF